MHEYVKLKVLIENQYILFANFCLNILQLRYVSKFFYNYYNIKNSTSSYY